MLRVWGFLSACMAFLRGQRAACVLHKHTEWYFRSGLDRYIWIWGMLCAYLHPHATKVLNAIEELPQPRRLAVRAGIVSAVGLAFGVYYHTIYSLPKVEYNKVRFLLREGRRCVLVSVMRCRHAGTALTQDCVVEPLRD